MADIVPTQSISHYAPQDYEVSPPLENQVASFMQNLQTYNSKLPVTRKRPHDDYEYLKRFFNSFITDRNSRSKEVASDEYQELLGKILTQFPVKTYLFMCAGGRNDPIHTNGASANIMESIRVPEHFQKEFARTTQGLLTVLEDSLMAEFLEDAFLKNDTIAIIIDSHTGCRARKIEAVNRGENPLDDGLYIDVAQKKEIIDAVQKYIKENYNGKKAICIQTSFNPNTGFLFMGLETLGSLVYATGIARGKAELHNKNPEKAAPEYAEDVLDFLLNRDVILSTARLVKQETIKEMFIQSYFQIDWKNNYIQSTRDFWNRISKMKDTLFPIIKEKVMHVYPQISTTDASNLELELRALILLTNAFNGYIHNPDQVSPGHNEHENVYNYEVEYNIHREQGILLADTDFPPHDIALITVTDDKNLASTINWGSRIVRKNRNRADNPIVDSTNTYLTQEEFIKAPVPIIVQEVVHDATLEDSNWQILKKIDWTDLPESLWEKMTDKQFAQYLEEKGERMPFSIANAIMELRRRMKKFYAPGHELLLDITEQTKVVLPILADAYGKTQTIIPFLKFGN